MTKATIPFAAADYLSSQEDMAEYLTAAMDEARETGDNAILLTALREIATARGMSCIAADTGLGRESLYKALKPGAHPRFGTILKVITALGLSLTAVPKTGSQDAA